jgi:nitroimidazol reductase NimA-like FMN-containing flavoprotein (pyridoxamine 5'-phosphate oxidase superfamily)
MEKFWDPGSLIPSIPFNREHYHLAARMKEAGLPWEPQVGCFVWDREGRIEAGSPFGDGVYFILDLKPFLRKLDTTNTMSKALVWLPDWHQALWICEHLGIDDDAITSVSVGINPTDAGEILLGLYNLILMALERTKKLHAPVDDQAKSLLHGTCGPLDDIEMCPQDWEAELGNQLQTLFSSRRLAVLATQHEGKPYASLVAFAATDDLKTIIFATTRSTRKFAYLSSNAAVALLIDNRTNEISDFRNAMAVTASGKAVEIIAGKENRFLQLYLAKHPYLKEFVSSPTCALVKVDVSTYYAVRRFQHVLEFHID